MGFGVVLVGLLAVLAAFIIAAFKVDSGDVSALFSGLTGVIGTIVGAYFGLQVGQAGKKEADKARDKAEDARDRADGQAKRALAELAPEQARTLM
jgi:uncharacterized protein YacL